MSDLIVDARLKDALYNLYGKSGASDEYCQGVVLGVVSTLMAIGMTFDRALQLVVHDMPYPTRRERLPAAWATDMLGRQRDLLYDCE